MAHTESVVGRPAAGLRALVRRYVGYRYEGFPPGTHLGLPSACLTLVISLAGPVRVGFHPDRPAEGYPTLASGLFAGPVHLPHDGHQYGVELELTPAGARSLLGVPAAGLAGLAVGLEELLGPAGRELPDRMAAAPDWPARFAVLEEVLFRRTERLAAAPEPLAHAWRAVLESGGTVRVAELAREVGWSRRHLSGRFAAEFGLSPKEVARIVRFQRTRRLLLRPGRPSLAEIAAGCGYFDQAHLAREWRALAGLAPSRWLATDEPVIPEWSAAD